MKSCELYHAHTHIYAHVLSESELEYTNNKVIFALKRVADTYHPSQRNMEISRSNLPIVIDLVALYFCQNGTKFRVDNIRLICVWHMKTSGYRGRRPKRTYPYISTYAGKVLTGK